MRTRDFNPEDLEQIKKLCEKHGEALPDRGNMRVSDNGKDNITGFICLRPVIMIEPMISESPVAAIRLFEDIDFKMWGSDVNILRAFTKPEKEGLLKKVGFERVFEDYIIMEKIYKR